MSWREQRVLATAGATLIEITIVIAIMVVSIAALVPLMLMRGEEAKLQEAANEIEAMARSARLTAVYEGGTSRIEFAEDGFRLVLEQVQNAELLADDEAFFTERVDQEVAEPAAGSSYQLAEGVKYKIRRWGSEQWIQPEDQSWVFRNSGISEPLAIRFEFEDAWLEQQFSALTAEVEDESYAFP